MLVRAALMVCFLAVPTVSSAQEKAPKKPVGTWARETDGNKLVFAIKAETLTIKLKTAEGELTAEATYGVTADGTLFGILTKVEKKGIEGASEKGDLFSFDISATKSELTISNLKGTRTSDGAAKLVEGVYTREKK